MRIIPFLILISLSTFAGQITITKSGPEGSLYIVGSCEDAKEQIRQFSRSAKIHCECEGKVCKTELTSHLPPRVQTALKFNQKEEGPNCWNAVLYAEGVNETFKNSEELEVYLASPYCSEVSGRPLAGDIINVYQHVKTPVYEIIDDDHSYLALSDTIAFNKSGPEIEFPNEIITIDEWMNRYKIPEKCRFTGISKSAEEKCSDIVVAYRCKNLKSIRDIWFEVKKDYPSKGVKKIAEDKLKMPRRLKDLPPSVRKLMNLDPNMPFDQELMNEDAKKVYLFAAPDMKLPELKIYREAILEARRLGFYPKLPLEERMMWMNVYYRGASL